MTRKVYNLLASSDYRQRQQAIEALSQLPDMDMAQKLIQIVRENHENLSALNAAMQVLVKMGRAPVKEIFDLLDSGDEQVRVYVPHLLGLLGNEQAIPVLVGRLEDENTNARFNAVEALGALKAGAAVEPLIGLLRRGRDDLFVCYAAVLALGEIGAAADDEAVGDKIAAELTPLMTEDYLAEAVVSALGCLGRADSIGLILDWLEQPANDPLVAMKSLAQILRKRSEVRLPAFARHIGAMRLNQAVETILAEQSEQESGVNEADEKADDAILADAGLVLGRLHQINPEDTHRRRLLVQLLAHPAARQAATAALRSSPLPAPPELIAALSDPDISFACAAAHVFVTLRDPQALDALIDALESEDRTLCTHAAEALGEMNMPQAVDALVERLNRPDVHFRQAVMKALARHPSAELSERMAGLLAAEDAHLREAAVRLLAEWRDARAAEAVKAALVDSEVSVRKAGVEVLPVLGSLEAAALLEQVLQDQDASLRASAARILAAFPAQQAIALLGRATQDADGWVRMYACRSLGQLGQAEGLPWLMACLTDRMPPVRLAAVEAMANIDLAASQAYFLPLLNDADAAVRLAAQRYCEQGK